LYFQHPEKIQEMEETVEVWETVMENRMIHYLDETPKGFKITSGR
jgi:hypothetical protein